MKLIGAEAFTKPRLVADRTLLRINIGCGNNHMDGHLNVDKEAWCHPDLTYDVERTPWPWQDNTTSEVYMNHVLEHLGHDPKVFIAIVKEVYRVLKIGGLWTINVPHPRSDGFISDPTHVRPITPHLMSMFSKTICRQTIAKGWANTPFAIYHDVDFEIIKSEYKLLEPWWTRLVKARETDNKEELEAVARAQEERWNVIGECNLVLQKVGHQNV